MGTQDHWHSNAPTTLTSLNANRWTPFNSQTCSAWATFPKFGYGTTMQAQLLVGLFSTWIRDDVLDQTFRFPCKRWFAKKEDDGQLIRELGCANNDILDLNETTKYEIITVTADTDEAETRENVWMILEGMKGRSKELVLENSGKKRRFLRGSTDRFEFTSKVVGDIAGICVGHIPKDGKKPKIESFWHVLEVTVKEKALGNRFIFNCNAPIPLSTNRDDPVMFERSKIVESFISKARSLRPVTYEIIVVTGDEKGASTNANVFITLFGTTGDSGRRGLRQRLRNLFEAGRTDFSHWSCWTWAI
ncbi:hypothetical protein AALO_G00162060 [Alosa alosa]|uniref:PLAT domain-containing protein n=1 Tax=Alosa alosa TaxID=278164 RepID=A0AAV6GFH2_9TELE|nr:hypothetical protein AALO_G00162060 [Alosa alosa]